MDLFADDQRYWREELVPGAVILRNFLHFSLGTSLGMSSGTSSSTSSGPASEFSAEYSAEPVEARVLAAVDEVTRAAPLRHLITPGGLRMSVAMTNCGNWGWWSDHAGYRYTRQDPTTGRNWPAMPPVFAELATRAAANAGFSDFAPDACLINRYVPGARLSLHQDKNEADLRQPIVSVSLGLPATFIFGGAQRSDKTQRTNVTHGDVAVWGGPARLNYHGVAPLKPGVDPRLGECRINITFRKAR